MSNGKHLAGIKVIIVEDNEHVQFVLTAMFDILGCVVEAKCKNVSDAIVIFESGQHFDLMILDLGLPDAPGQDLIKYLYNKKVSLPILIFSGLLSSDRNGTLKYLDGGLTIKYHEKGGANFSLSDAIRDVFELHAQKHKITELETKLANSTLQVDLLRRGIRRLSKYKVSTVVLTGIVSIATIAYFIWKLLHI